MATATLPSTARSTPSPFAKTKPRRRHWVRMVLSLAAASVVIAVVRPMVFPLPAIPPEPRDLPLHVSGLGRLTPESDVISIAPPTPTGAMSGARVEKLLVSVGEEVRAGQVVAILDTHRGREASVRQSQSLVAVTRAKLALINAGPKLDDVRAQEAAIRRAKADLTDAKANYERVKKLIATNAISQEELQTRQLRREQAEASLEQEMAKLEALKMVRPEDVQGAEAELAQAEAALAIAEEDLRNTEVRSPISGRILKIRARSGERIAEAGLLDVGDTNVMYVVAEIYEADVAKVRVGQAARVRIPTLGEKSWLAGEVVSKDLVIARQDLFDNDPVADIDSRIVEVHIRLSAEDGAQVAGLSNARAEVVIDVSGERP